MMLVMMKKMFFTELHRIVRLKLPASKDLHLDKYEEVFLALIKTCKVEQDEYGYWKYMSLRGFKFIDLATIKCTVGHIYDQDAWYIVDRSGQILW